MEIAIAIGIGGWFVLAGVVSTIAVHKSFKTEEENGKK